MIAYFCQKFAGKSPLLRPRHIWADVTICFKRKLNPVWVYLVQGQALVGL